MFDLVAHITHQAQWSEHTFGPGPREESVIDHIKEELQEVEDAETPEDKLTEWIDVIILGLDGAWRSGASPQEIVEALVAKQSRNEKRQWPDWRTQDTEKKIKAIKPGNTHPFDPGWSGQSSTCNHLVVDDGGYGKSCDLSRYDEVHHG